VDENGGAGGHCDDLEVVVIVARDGQVPHPPVMDGPDRPADHHGRLAVSGTASKRPAATSWRASPKPSTKDGPTKPKDPASASTPPPARSPKPTPPPPAAPRPSTSASPPTATSPPQPSQPPDTDMTADDLTAALHACAAGFYPLEAGVTLLISNGTFLHRDDFTRRFITRAPATAPRRPPSNETPPSPH
jgi:hypothetical protein